MLYRVLGPVEVDDGTAVRRIASPSQRVVLAALVARRPGIVPLDVLVDAVWGDEPPRSAVQTLRTYVSRLRQVVGDDIEGSDAGYRLAVVDEQVDAARFEETVRRARAASPEDASALVGSALSLWRGPAFGDLGDHPLVRADAVRLDELRLAARELRATLLLRTGDAAAAVADAEALVAEHPLREGAWVTLARALVAAARSAEAVRAVARARAVLADSGLEPSADLRAAERAALGLEPPASVQVVAAPVVAAPVRRLTDREQRGRPPRPTSSFVGRDELLARCLDLVVRHRCVTLTGPGGVGKTRLALETAAAAADRFELGAVLVELGDVADPDDVADVVAAALRLAGSEPARERIARAGDLDVLLVVDNAEHVVDAVADVVAAMTRGGASCHVLVTSQERLGVDGEQVCVVEPLDRDGTAQALFRDRVAAAGVPVDPVDATHVDRIVARLDGLPLAIEMAAASAATTTLAELGDLLERDLAALASARRDVASRHRSLAALLDWSIGRLDDAEQRTLHELTVFAGGVDSGDVTGVLGDRAVPIVRRLAERSLLRVRRDGPAARYTVWTTVRSHVTERWGDVPASLRARHAEWFVGQAGDAGTRMLTPDEGTQVRRLTAMLPELRAAHRWAAANDRSLALALTAALHPWAQMHLLDEVLAWAEPLVAAPVPTDDPTHLAIAMVSAATRALNRGDHEPAVALARRALDLAPDDRTAILALEVISDGSLYHGRLDESAAASRELRDRAERCGEPWYRSMGVTGLALAAAYAGAPGDGDVGDEEDATLAPTPRAFIAYTKAELAVGDPDRAFRLYERALELAALAPGSLVEGVALASASALRARVGDVDEAVEVFQRAIAHWLRVADLTHQVTTLRNLVVLLRRLDLAGEAAELLGSVDAMVVPTYGSEARLLAEAGEWVRHALGDEELAERTRRGAARDVTAAARWSLEVLARTAAAGRLAADADA